MTWEDYYDKFYDWSRSTQIKHLSSVGKLGPKDEVAEIMMEFAFDRQDIANRVARRAIGERIQFTAEDIMNFKLCIDDELLDQLAIQSANKFSKEDLDELLGLIDDDAMKQIYQLKGSESTFYFDSDEEEKKLDNIDEVLERAKQPTGFFSKLALAFGIGYGVKQGISSVNERKAFRYRIGDHVRVKYRGQEGTIIDINGDLYMVSLSDGGYVDSFYENQIERAW